MCCVCMYIYTSLTITPGAEINIGWFISYAALATVSSSVTAYFLHTSFFSLSSPLFIYILLLLFMLGYMSIAFVLAPYFTEARTALTFGTISTFLMLLPFYVRHLDEGFLLNLFM